MTSEKQIEHSVASDSLRTTQDSGTHTQGRLMIWRDRNDNTLNLSAESSREFVCLVGALNDCGEWDIQRIESDARRLKAAWNAVDGIPTEDLESKVVVGFMADLKRQKDETVRALSAAVECLREVMEAFSLETDFGVDASSRRLAAKKKARQFLATQGKK